MNYIKFDTINSTNEFLKSYSQSQDLQDFFYVIADFQTQGKGQRANDWKSECCKNLLISIFMKPNFPVAQQYRLNHIVSLAIVDVLQQYDIPEVQIKLPNDILSGGKKISGILIENKIQQNEIKQSIIGIGLNINQTDFVHLPDAVSMKSISGKSFDIQQIAELLVQKLQNLYQSSPNVLEKRFKELLTKQILNKEQVNKNQ